MMSERALLEQEIGDAFDEVRKMIPMPDTYQIERSVRVPDGSGGTTTMTQTLEEGWPCRLATTARLSSERLEGAVIAAVSSYTLALPLTTSLTTTDTVVVNGTRRFAVVSPPKRAGTWALNVIADVEERR